MFVAIEGCIGSGKTSTATLVGRSLGWPVLLEDLSGHPFLEEFYRDQSALALETELAFVLLHYHQFRGAGREQNLVADFAPGKDYMFGRINLAGHDWTIFEYLYSNLVPRSPKPDMVAFLDLPVEVLLRRIQKRGRPFERSITEGYLGRLREAYLSHLSELGARVEVLEVDSHDSRELVARAVLELINRDFVPNAEAQ